MVITQAHDEQFKNHENRHHIIFLTFIFVLTIAGILLLVVPIKILYGPESIPIVGAINRYWVNLIDILIVLGWNWQYYTTTKLIQVNFSVEYDKMKVQMKYFYLIETIPLTLNVIMTFAYMVLTFTMNDNSFD